MAAQKAQIPAQKVKKYIFNVINSDKPGTGIDKLDFVLLLENAINKRLLVGKVRITALSRFIDEDGRYVAYGYAEVGGKLKPMEVKVFPAIGRVAVHIGVMWVNFDVDEIIPKGEVE